MRRRLTVALKITVSAALVAFVLLRVDLAGVATSLRGLTAGALGAALGLTFLSIAVSAWRWHRVLAHLGERVSPWALAGDTLVGATYNLLLPTSIGGDVARGLRCARRVRDAEHAWASVAFERLLGLLSLALVSALGLLLGLPGDSRPMFAAAAAMAAAITLIILGAPRPLRMLAALTAGRAPQVTATLERVAVVWRTELTRPWPRLETFFWSLVYQMVALTILLPVALVWGVDGAWSAIYLGVPVVLVAATLPVSLGGHGLRESLFVVVLVRFGLEAPQALALSLVWLASNLAVGCAGLGVLLATRSTDIEPRASSPTPPHVG